jgi:hypothetical protein
LSIVFGHVSMGYQSSLVFDHTGEGVQFVPGL